MSNNYNIEDRKDKSNPTILMDAIVDVYASSLQFYSRLNRSFLDALFVPFTDAREELREMRKVDVKNEKNILCSLQRLSKISTTILQRI